MKRKTTRKDIVFTKQENIGKGLINSTAATAGGDGIYEKGYYPSTFTTTTTGPYTLTSSGTTATKMPVWTGGAGTVISPPPPPSPYTWAAPSGPSFSVPPLKTLKEEVKEALEEVMNESQKVFMSTKKETLKSVLELLDSTESLKDVYNAIATIRKQYLKLLEESI